MVGTRRLRGIRSAGKVSGARMDFLLTITMPDLRAFLASEEHAGVAVGKRSFDPFHGSGSSACAT